MPRTITQSLSAAASIGVLTLGLAACGEGGEDTGAETPDTTTETTAPTTDTTSAPSPSAGESTEESGTTPSTSGTPTESATGSATESASAEASGDIEDAIQKVMGDEAQILSSAELRRASESMQGLTEDVTIEPAECGMGESGMSTSFPEDAEMHGGILTDATNPSAPSSQVLSTVTFSDAEQAQELVTQAREFAETCSTFSLDMGGGLSATSNVTLEDVSVDDADDVLAHTSEIEVEMEGATLPPGASQSTTTTVYVLSGDTLYQFVQAGEIEGAEALETGEQMIEELRAELAG